MLWWNVIVSNHSFDTYRGVLVIYFLYLFLLLSVYACLCSGYFIFVSSYCDQSASLLMCIITRCGLLNLYSHCSLFVIRVCYYRNVGPVYPMQLVPFLSDGWTTRHNQARETSLDSPPHMWPRCAAVLAQSETSASERFGAFVGDWATKHGWVVHMGMVHPFI